MWMFSKGCKSKVSFILGMQYMVSSKMQWPEKCAGGRRLTPILKICEQKDARRNAAQTSRNGTQRVSSWFLVSGRHVEMQRMSGSSNKKKDSLQLKDPEENSKFIEELKHTIKCQNVSLQSLRSVLRYGDKILAVTQRSEQVIIRCDA